MIIKEEGNRTFDFFGDDGELEFRLVNVHLPEACASVGCIIHGHPSNHALKDAPMVWTESRGVLEQICEHGISHTDYDSALYLKSIGQVSAALHMCDGCCGHVVTI